MSMIKSLHGKKLLMTIRLLSKKLACPPPLRPNNSEQLQVQLVIALFLRTKEIDQIEGADRDLDFSKKK